MPGPRKVPDTAVRHIRQHEFKAGDVGRFAAMYGVTPQSIIAIRDGHTYKDVT